MADHQSPAPAVTPNDTELPSTSLQPYLEQVDGMDICRDAPSNVVDNAGRVSSVKLSAPTVETLAPEMRGPIVEKLHGLTGPQRQQAEARLVREAMQTQVDGMRHLMGLGEDALPYHQTQISIARRVHDLDRAIEREVALMADISGYDTSIDPVTGEATHTPRFRHSAAARDRASRMLRDLEHERSQFIKEDGSPGIQAQRELEQARQESAVLLQKIDQQRWEAQEAERRAAKINSEERINRQAQARARMTRDTI